jgi:hypothetical protein
MHIKTFCQFSQDRAKPRRTSEGKASAEAGAYGCGFTDNNKFAVMDLAQMTCSR